MAPFDALAGFDDEINSKLIQYCEKRMLSDEEKNNLNKRLSKLHSLTYNSRAARLNRPQASVTYFVSCSDPHSEWHERGGQYKTITGTVSRVDNLISNTITVDDQNIPLDAVSEIILPGA